MVRFSILLAILVGAVGTTGQVIRAEAGLVKKVDGEVLVHCHTRESGFSRLRRGEVLHTEDLVVTSAGGSTVFSLNPDSYLQMSAGTTVRIRETVLRAMRFDVETGEVIVMVGRLKDGASLVLYAPPGILEIRKKGLYRISVGLDGNTQVNVVRGELVYTDAQNRPRRVKKGRQVDFLKRASKVVGRVAEY